MNVSIFSIPITGASTAHKSNIENFDEIQARERLSKTKKLNSCIQVIKIHHRLGASEEESYKKKVRK